MQISLESKKNQFLQNSASSWALILKGTIDTYIERNHVKQKQKMSVETMEKI